MEYINQLCHSSCRISLLLTLIFCFALDWCNDKDILFLLWYKHSSINLDYCVRSCPILWSKKVKYLGVVISSKLKWNDHCLYVVSKVTKCLNHLRRGMFGCTQEAKINAYMALVRPYLEYACAMWAPYTIHDIDLLETVQNRAARWIKISGIHQLISGLNILQLVFRNWGGLPSKHAVFIFPLRLPTVFYIKPLPLIF